MQGDAQLDESPTACDAAQDGQAASVAGHMLQARSSSCWKALTALPQAHAGSYMVLQLNESCRLILVVLLALLVPLAPVGSQPTHPLQAAASAGYHQQRVAQGEHRSLPQLLTP